MADIFKEVIPSILQTKKHVLLDDLDEKEYVPYMVNKTLSYHVDCILYANEMNQYYNIDKMLQYEYYLHSIRSMKRPFNKWHKKVADEDLVCVKKYFGYSTTKAREALKILTKIQIDEIRELTEIGGTKKK